MAQIKIKTSSPEERKALFRSLIISIIILAVGLAWGLKIGKEANIIDHGLDHEQDYVDMLRNAHNAPKGQPK